MYVEIFVLLIKKENIKKRKERRTHKSTIETEEMIDYVVVYFLLYLFFAIIIFVALVNLSDIVACVF